MAVLVVAAGIWLVARDRAALSSSYRQIGALGLLGSTVFAVLGTACIGACWLSIVRGLGGQTRLGPAARLFFGTQLGKYLPGSVWPIAAQMEFGRRTGLGRSRMLLANLFMIAVITLTGLLAGALALPWASPDGLAGRWWLFVFVLPLLACLHPRAVPALLDRLLVLLRRQPLGLRVQPRALLAAVGWGCATWILLGAHLWIMVRALGGHGGAALAASIGGMGLAFAAGLIFIPAPAGAGIREAILVASLSSAAGHTQALAVALASRVELVLADVALAVLGAVLARLPHQDERDQPTDSSEVSSG
ncbi:flippase-like domain-containing protein [Jatrophihabitans telluris]|uniref:Flippase-like domain-containing protein n=1 Tax=Jatrophihabitans telluris TaxID=2038343 RepID=A0ABY4QYH5_9ACTN|nr:lysylphosphatidylglycerol synthase domain-containing protein [Jatrophihabitans telluris]UQX88182.1 flippase-like domain-containing protein [Jatrophihabitans telluris]